MGLSLIGKHLEEDVWRTDAMFIVTLSTGVMNQLSRMFGITMSCVHVNECIDYAIISSISSSIFILS